MSQFQIARSDLHYAISPATYLAPMAGQSNRAFRELCREIGGVGMVCTELVSSQALENRGSRKQALAWFDFAPSESPLAVQLFGCQPQVMAEAARIIVDCGAPIIDINMGCWVPKVVKKGGGAALLGDCARAQAVVQAVVEAVQVPVTVKVRSGVTAGQITAIAFARAAQQCGVSAITVHARTAEQGFSGQADWSVISEVRQAVNIPVIGNGDLSNWDEALQMQQQTGCHAWMVGRAALGSPWIFAQWAGLLPAGTPPLPFRAAVAWRHLQLTQRYSPLQERQAVRELRGQLARYRLDQPGHTSVRDRLVRLQTYAEGHLILGGLAQHRDWREAVMPGVQSAPGRSAAWGVRR